MKNLTISTRIFACIALAAGALWIGAYAGRLSVTYILYEETGFILKDYVTPDNIPGIMKTLTPVFSLTFILYSVFIISFTIFLLKSKINLKENGWLFIIAVIVYFTLPFEAYLMTIDYRLITNLDFGNFNYELGLKLITDRFENLSSFPIILLFCYMTIPVFLIFKPLVLRKNTDEA